LVKSRIKSDIMEQRLKTIAKGAVLTAAGVWMSKILTYGYRSAIARFGGPEIYGQLAQAIAVLTVFGTLSTLSTQRAIRTFVPRYLERGDDSKLRGTVISTILITMPASLISTALMFILAEPLATVVFESPGVAPAIKVMAFVPPFATLSKIGISTTVGFNTVKYQVINNNIVQNLTQLGGAVVLLFAGFELFAATGSWLFGYVITGLLALYFMEFKVGPVLRLDAVPKMQYRKILRFSIPLMFSNIVAAVLGYTDIVFIGHFFDDSTVGVYNAALPAAQLVSLPAAGIGSLALPSISGAREEGKSGANILSTVIRWTFYASFPAFIVVVLFSGPLLRLLFGGQYVVGAAATVILGLSVILGNLTSSVDEYLMSSSRTELIAKNSVGHLALNIPLNFILVPLYGIEGAALATTISVIVIDAVLIYELLKIEQVNPYGWYVAKPVLASLPGLVSVWVCLQLFFETVPVWSLVPGGLGYGILYVAGMVATRAFNEDDREIITSGFRRLGNEKMGEKVADFLVR